MQHRRNNLGVPFALASIQEAFEGGADTNRDSVASPNKYIKTSNHNNSFSQDDEAQQIMIVKQPDSDEEFKDPWLRVDLNLEE